MITKEMQLHRNNYKYKVESLDVLFSNGSVESIESGMVTHLYIEKDFDGLYFPIINISVVMKDELYDKINRENEQIKFRLKVNKYVYDSSDAFISYKSFCNDVFICFSDKKVIINDEESVKIKENVESSDTPSNRANNRNFYLFKEDVIKCKETMNLSVTSATISDLVIYMFNQCGIDKLLMSKLDNDSEVNNLLIPTGNLIECFNYLNEMKGFYNKGLLLYFDLDNAYFIDNSSKCTAWRRNEVRMTHMHISNQKNASSQLTGMYTNKDRKSNHIFANTDRIEITNQNILNDQIQGNNITIINNKSNNIDNIKEDTTQIGKANKNVVVMKENNRFMVNEIKERLKENECVLSIAFLGIDLDCLTPNKEFLLTYEDSKLNKKYGGGYRLSKYTATFKKDGDELVGGVECLFKKQG